MARLMTPDPRSLARVAIGYTAGALAVSLTLGIVRAVWLFRNGTLPDQYLLHGFAWNAGLAFALALALLPATLAADLLLRRTRFAPVDFGSLAGMLGACLPLWVLSTSLEYRNPATWAASLAQEARYWLPALGAIAVLWWSLLARRPDAVVLRRCAASAAVCLVGAASLGLYAATRASTALPLDLEASAQRRPPVFLVLVDTLRADHLSAYGYPKPTSPNVDALARDGTLHERAFAQSPWTRPSCGALLTSRYPPEIGLRGMWSPLPAEVPILPQFLRNEGYATAGIVSSVHLSAQYGFDKGWDVLDLGTTYLRWTGVKRALGRLRLIARSEVYPRYDAEQLTDRAIQWIDAQQGSGAPLFMYLHYSDPHSPYRPPPEQDRWLEFASEEARQVAIPPIGPPRLGERFSPAESEALVARYDAEIAFFDTHFGRLLDFLEQRGIYDEALIIFTADHGEEFAEHGGWAHGHTLYNELLHIPLIVKYPKGVATPGERREMLSGLIDVVPTIRDVMQATWPQSGFRGRSLLPADVGPRDDPRIVYADNENPALRGGFQGDDKLIQRLSDAGSVQEERYFSLDSDFGERGDGVPPGADSAERLRELRGVMAELHDQALVPGEIDVDEDTHEELRALGYIE